MNFAIDGFSVDHISKVDGGVQATVHFAQYYSPHFILLIGMDTTLIHVEYFNGIADTKVRLPHLGVAVFGSFDVFFRERVQHSRRTLAGRFEFPSVSKARPLAVVHHGHVVNLKISQGVLILWHNFCG